MKEIQQTIEVKIETRHFKSALAYASNYNCPLAQALKEAFPESKYDLCVGSRSVNLTVNKSKNCYKISGWYESAPNDFVAQNEVNDLINKALAGEETPTYNVTLTFEYKIS